MNTKTLTLTRTKLLIRFPKNDREKCCS